MDKPDLLKHLKAEGFSSEVITAFDHVKREDFIPKDYQRFAYEDAALPINCNQTISQPSTIAFMLDLLELEEEGKILEIGCGSGYVLSLLSYLCPKAKIYGTERMRDLFVLAKKRLKAYKNVEVFYTPDKVGVPEKKPFNRILLSASAHNTPYYIIEQLENNGVAVCPVRRSIIKFKRKGNNIEKEEYYGFSFVPLIE